MSASEDARQYAPSTARNRDVIRDVFREHMLNSGTILEVASGTGEHGVYITDGLPGLNWAFTDFDANFRRSQSAWITHEARANLSGPYILDASAADWGTEIEALNLDGMVCINMIHIAPFEVCQGLFAGAGRLLKSGQRLFLYGPYRRDGKQTSPSNEVFEDWLKARDGRFGVRDLESQILPLASRNNLELAHIIDMPANNFVLIFEKV